MAQKEAGPTGEHIIYKHVDRSRAQPWYGNINGIYGTLTRDSSIEFQIQNYQRGTTLPHWGSPKKSIGNIVLHG